MKTTKSIFVFISTMLLPLLAFSQATKKVATNYPQSKSVKEIYYVLRKKKHIKSGEYRHFHKNATLKEVGTFTENVKTGIWKTFNEKGALRILQEFEKGKKISEKRFGIWLEYHEKGEVVTGFDYDKNESIPTQIRVSIKYPPKAREAGIEGVVKIKLHIDENCEIQELHLVEGISPDCDKEALTTIQRFYTFMKKYNIENCQPIEGIIPHHFRLD